MHTKSKTLLFGVLSYICKSENGEGNISYKPQLDGNTGKQRDHQTHLGHFHDYGIEGGEGWASPKINKTYDHRNIVKETMVMKEASWDSSHYREELIELNDGEAINFEDSTIILEEK